MGRVEPWKAYYDEYGRIIARIDYNAGNIAEGIANIHYHLFRWGQGEIAFAYANHIAGEYIR